MKASDARVVTDIYAQEDKWSAQLRKRVEESETPVGVLVDACWGSLMDLVLAKAEEGKSRLMTEPFILIPGNLYTQEQSREMADLLCERLGDFGYLDVSWCHRDLRVIVTLNW